jgi:SOS-response transcriptional repressor LexA
MKWIAKKLREGEIVEFRPKGHSMKPLIESGDLVVIEPTDTAEVGDIVLCKVRGSHYLHKVLAKKANGRCQIGNNRGYINGWTKQIFGKLVENKGK